MEKPTGGRAEPQTFRFSHCVLDVSRAVLRVGDREIELRPKTFEVLRYMVRHPDRLITKDELLEAVWGATIVGDESLAQCVSELRHALGDDQRLIVKTVPRRGYRFTAAVSVAAPAIVAAQPSSAPTASINDGQSSAVSFNGRRNGPVIAVLPFRNLTGARADYFSDGITDDIVTELSRFSELMILASNSTFRYREDDVDVRQIGRELGAHYVVEGGLRRDGERVRVSAKLIATASGAHLWAESYDRRVSDLFDFQDALARAIAAVLAVRVEKSEADRVLLTPPQHWRAYDYYLRATEAFRKRGRLPTALNEARHMVEQALRIDPEYARAQALCSKIEWWTYVEPLDASYADPGTLERAHDFAQAAVQLAPLLPEAHAQLAWMLVFKRQHDAGLREFEHAFALNRNFVDSRFALAQVYAGAPGKCFEVLEATLQLDPFQPFDSFAFAGHARYMLGDYSGAVRDLALYRSRAPLVRILALWLAAAHAQAGELDSARGEADRVRRLEPDFTIRRWQVTAVYRRAEDFEHLIGGIRKSGLPDA